MSPRRMVGVASSISMQGSPLSLMGSSYNVLAAIDVQRIARHPIGGGMAERGDAARHILRRGEPLVRIAEACDLHQLFVAGDEPQRGRIGNARHDRVGRDS